MLGLKILSWFVITWNSNMKVSRAETIQTLSAPCSAYYSASLIFSLNDKTNVKISICALTQIFHFGSVVYKLRNLFGYAFFVVLFWLRMIQCCVVQRSLKHESYSNCNFFLLSSSNCSSFLYSDVWTHGHWFNNVTDIVSKRIGYYCITIDWSPIRREIAEQTLDSDRLR